jgi:poly-gamma-glutamate capsule biosynthesis protein CapA/YwtB (metallophosphatase superfamily)
MEVNMAKNTGKTQKYFICMILAIVFIISSCASAPVLETVSDDEVTFCAAGDVMLDRGVRKQMSVKGDFDPFKRTTAFIKTHDLAFCNLEGPVSLRGAMKKKAFAFRFDPVMLEGLKVSGFNMFSLANNHILDYGREALTDTIEFMNSNNYFYAGAGKDRKSAMEARFLEKNGIKFAFIAHVDMEVKTEGAADSPDVPQVSDECGIDEITAEVARARKLADFVIVSFHWGEEYTNFPLKKHIRFARACVDSGADLVLGHHPHVLQGVEIYKGKAILYSLGNFVFDQYQPGTNDSMVFCCKFTKAGIKDMFLMPVRITLGQPDFASGDTATDIKTKIKQYSQNFNVILTDNFAKIQISDKP